MKTLKALGRLTLAFVGFGAVAVGLDYFPWLHLDWMGPLLVAGWGAGVMLIAFKGESHV